MTIVIALSLFLNTLLILIVSTLLPVFTASIGRRRGRKRSRPSNFYNSLYSNLYNSLCNSLYKSLYSSLYNSLCNSLRNSLYNSLYSSLCNSLYNSPYATTLVITSSANPSNLVSLKLIRSALKIKKPYTKSLSRYS